MKRPESDFPTIADARNRLQELVDMGLGDHPVQVLVVPDSTLQAISQKIGKLDPTKPAIAIDFGTVGDPERMALMLISAERLDGRGMVATEQ